MHSPGADLADLKCYMMYVVRNVRNIPHVVLLQDFLPLLSISPLTTLAFYSCDLVETSSIRTSCVPPESPGPPANISGNFNPIRYSWIQKSLPTTTAMSSGVLMQQLHGRLKSLTL